jgi:hypothetical protein
VAYGNESVCEAVLCNRLTKFLLLVVSIDDCVVRMNNGIGIHSLGLYYISSVVHYSIG